MPPSAQPLARRSSSYNPNSDRNKNSKSKNKAKNKSKSSRPSAQRRKSAVLLQERNTSSNSHLINSNAADDYNGQQHQQHPDNEIMASQGARQQQHRRRSSWFASGQFDGGVMVVEADGSGPGPGRRGSHRRSNSDSVSSLHNSVSMSHNSGWVGFGSASEFKNSGADGNLNNSAAFLSSPPLLLGKEYEPDTHDVQRAGGPRYPRGGRGGLVDDGVDDDNDGDYLYEPDPDRLDPHNNDHHHLYENDQDHYHHNRDYLHGNVVDDDDIDDDAAGEEQDGLLAHQDIDDYGDAELGPEQDLLPTEPLDDEDHINGDEDALPDLEDDEGGLTDEEDFEGGAHTHDEEHVVDPSVVKRMRDLLKRELPRKSVQMLAPKDKRRLQDHLVNRTRMQQTFGQLAGDGNQDGFVLTERAGVRARIRSQASKRNKKVPSDMSRASDESGNASSHNKQNQYLKSTSTKSSSTRRRKDGRKKKSKRRGSASPPRREDDEQLQQDKEREDFMQHYGGYQQLEDSSLHSHQSERERRRRELGTDEE